MSQDLSQWVRAFRGRRVLLVGDLILDRYIYGDAERVSPEAPVLVLRAVEKHETVGGSANVAACLKTLGGEVVCCGAVGSDRHGESLTALLKELHIDTSGVVTLPDRPTTTKTRLVGLAQHRHRQQLLRLDEEDTRAISDEMITKLIDRACNLMSDVDVVCIEDYNKGVITEALVQAIVEKAADKKLPVLVDPARLNNYDRYRGATMLTPNREELSLVAGQRFQSLDDVASAANELIEKYNVRAVVATVDREGAVLAQKDQEWQHLTTIPRSVYDNTGAGDAVLAMLAAAIAAGADFSDATRLANIAGGLEVERFGCVPITADEVLAELRLEDQQRNGKLRNIDELVSELKLRRDRGETVAFTNGCFDILHAGHVEYLKQSRREASLLVVGLNGDASVRTLNKGKNRPYNTFKDRATVLSAMECVDYVVGFEESDPENLIFKVRPDVLTKGSDWAKKGIVGQEFVESIGGRVVLIPLVEGLSTTNLIERMKDGA